MHACMIRMCLQMCVNMFIHQKRPVVKALTFKLSPHINNYVSYQSGTLGYVREVSGGGGGGGGGLCCSFSLILPHWPHPLPTSNGLWASSTFYQII